MVTSGSNKDSAEKKLAQIEAMHVRFDVYQSRRFDVELLNFCVVGSSLWRELIRGAEISVEINPARTPRYVLATLRALRENITRGAYPVTTFDVDLGDVAEWLKSDSDSTSNGDVIGSSWVSRAEACKVRKQVKETFHRSERYDDARVIVQAERIVYDVTGSELDVSIDRFDRKRPTKKPPKGFPNWPDMSIIANSTLTARDIRRLLKRIVEEVEANGLPKTIFRTTRSAAQRIQAKRFRLPTSP